MLAYVLALVVGSGSLGLYLAAFLFPEVHRKYDLIWSGVGLFYALVLWVCAGRISGAVLLGQIASVSLLGWLSWQTLSLRRAQTPMALRTQIPESATSATDVAQLTVQQLRSNLQQSAGRSSLVDQLDRGITQLERAWLDLRSWTRAWSDTTRSNTTRSNPTWPDITSDTTDTTSSNGLPEERNGSLSPDAKANLEANLGLKPNLSSSANSRPNPTPNPQPGVSLRSQLNSNPKRTAKPNAAENVIYAPPDFLTADFLASESNNASRKSEPYAEWSDLEPESCPDMDTIDGSLPSYPPSHPPSHPPSYPTPQSSHRPDWWPPRKT